MLEKFSHLLCITRQVAINHLKAALQKLPTWRPRYRVKGVKSLWTAPSPPVKFLDIGTKMGLYEIEGLTLCRDRLSVHHSRSTERVRAPNTFYEACIKGLVHQDHKWENPCGVMRWHGQSTR